MKESLPCKVHRNRNLAKRYELPDARGRVRKLAYMSMLDLSDLLSQYKIWARGQ